jgi:acyl-CoA thioesterase
MHPHPFADLIGLVVTARDDGRSRSELQIVPAHLNPHQVVHGAVLFALADTGMGAALYPSLVAGESCATIELKLNFFRPAAQGTLVCDSTIVNRGRTIANLESRILLGDKLVATANGNFAIFARRPPAG